MLNFTPAYNSSVITSSNSSANVVQDALELLYILYLGSFGTLLAFGKLAQWCRNNVERTENGNRTSFRTTFRLS